jgi:hypothetical protein
MEERKLNNEIIRRLRSDKPGMVIPVLNHLRQSVHASAYLNEIVNLLYQTSNENTRREISLFLSDLKDPAAVPQIIKALNNTRYRSVWNIITEACWQSGLDFSNNIDTFIRLFLEEDYLTALEAFSVIEQSVHLIEYKNLKVYRQKLVESLENIDKEKAPLVREMIKIMLE